MITVAIMINGHPLMSRAAARIEDPDKDGKATYKLDSGRVIKHAPVDGAISLAHKLLDDLDEGLA